MQERMNNMLRGSEEFYFTNPFERGDIVKCKIGGKEIYGVIDTSQKEWNQIRNYMNNQRIENNIRYLYLRVNCIDEHNHFFSIECLPNDIEKIDIQNLKDEHRILIYAENLLKYESSLAKFLDFYERYKI